jgi:hypothetical protein
METPTNSFPFLKVLAAAVTLKEIVWLRAEVKAMRPAEKLA